MKRILITISLLATTMLAHAQYTEVRNAENMLMLQQYDKAKEAIDKAAVHKKTSLQPETFVLKSQIYAALALLDTAGKYKDMPLSKEAEIALTKAQELDPKKKYATTEIIAGVQHNLYAGLYNKAVIAYQQDDFKTALKNFRLASQYKPGDTALIFNTGIVAEKLKDTLAQKEAFEQLVQMGYAKDAYIYQSLYGLYKAENKAEKALAVLSKGRELLPTDNNLMLTELDYYIQSNQLSILKDKLQKALGQDPGNKSLYIALGSTYEKTKETDSALASYAKVLAIDPAYFEANFNIGAIYFNQAVQIINRANALPANKMKEYEQGRKKFAAKAEQALPFLTKAYQAKPTDPNVLQALKDIYTRTGNAAGATKMKKELDALR